MHIHTRIGMRASSDARLAAARGLGRYSRWTRDQHVFGLYCRTSATRGVGSDSDFQVWGSSDDTLLTSPTRGWLSDCACIHLQCRVPSHRSSGLLVAQCQGSRFNTWPHRKPAEHVASSSGSQSSSSSKAVVAVAAHARTHSPRRTLSFTIASQTIASKPDGSVSNSTASSACGTPAVTFE
jgi:hypothetical protein